VILTPTLTVIPIEPHGMAGNLTDKNSAFRALNQILSVSAGSRYARATDSLKVDPSARIQKVIEMSLEEAAEVSRNMTTDPNADRALAQINRKLDTLRSLALLSRIIQQEVIWDD